AAATAALYPNIEHVVVANEGGSSLADLDRRFFLLERPEAGIYSSGWADSLDKAIRKPNVRDILGGCPDIIGLSYSGTQLLPELLRRGRWLHLWREASALVGSRKMRWRGVLANTFGPWCALAIWGWVNRIGRPSPLQFSDYTAIHPR